MAQVRNNIVIQGLSGSLGNQLIIKQSRSGRTIVSAKPMFKPNRIFSDAQKSQQVAFREATSYAQAVKNNPIYIQKAERLGVTPYNLAVADWFHAPEILEVNLDEWSGQAGQVICVSAVDDVQVNQIRVSILDANDAVLEQGNATQIDGVWWQYTTQMGAGSSAKVLVSAQDLPGHITTITKAR